MCGAFEIVSRLPGCLLGFRFGGGGLLALTEVLEIESLDEVLERGQALKLLLPQGPLLGVTVTRDQRLAGFEVHLDACLVQHLVVGEYGRLRADRQRYGVSARV